MRTRGAALGTASNWWKPMYSIIVDFSDIAHRISNYMVVQITPLGIANLGWKFYLIWVVFNAIFVPV